MKRNFIFLIIIVIMAVSVLGYAIGSLEFFFPTPGNNSYANHNWTEINLTVNSNNISTALVNWNGTNYTFYDSSLVLLMNLNNNSAIGENNTKFVDSSKYGNNGTNNSVLSYVSGKFGNAVTFDGVDDYINAGNAESLQITGAITVEAWINIKMPIGEEGPIVARYAEPDDTAGWMLYIDEAYTQGGVSATMYPYCGGSGNNSDITNDGLWHHVAFSNDPLGNILVYLDGNIVYQAAGCTADVANQNVTIGKKINVDNWHFNGSIDNVRIYNRSLSFSEIQMHVQSEFQKFNGSSYKFYSNVSKLTDGLYTYYLWANDTDNNINQSVKRYVTIDTINPLLALISPQNTSYNTTNTTLNFSATDTNINTIWYEYNGTNTTITGNTTFTALNNQQSNITLYMNDSAGHTNSSSRIFFTVDTLYPVINWTTGTAANNSNVSQKYIFMNTTWTESNFNSITFWRDGISAIYSSPQYNYNATGLADGTYTYYVVICDIVNNCNQTTTKTITLDTVINYTNATRTPSGDINKLQLETFYITVNDSHLDTIWLQHTNFSNISNSENYTLTNHVGDVYNISFSPSLTGSMSYRFFMNDTSGNINYTSSFDYIVSGDSGGAGNGGGGGDDGDGLTTNRNQTVNISYFNYSKEPTKITIPMKPGSNYDGHIYLTSTDNRTINLKITKECISADESCSWLKFGTPKRKSDGSIYYEVTNDYLTYILPQSSIDLHYFATIPIDTPVKNYIMNVIFTDDNGVVTKSAINFEQPTLTQKPTDLSFLGYSLFNVREWTGVWTSFDITVKDGLVAIGVILVILVFFKILFWLLKSGKKRND